jgi:hypothetical protein
LPGNRINLVYSQRRLAVHPVVAAVDPMCLMGSVTMPCITSAIEGDGADLRSGSALDVRGRKDYISRLTRSERPGPEVRLVGARRLPQREIEASPPWRAINIFGVALMNRSNRIDYIRLTSHPDPNAKVRFPIHWGAERARAWPDHRHRFPTAGPQRHSQAWGVVRALPSACSVLRYARSDPAAGSDKYISSCKDRPFSAMDGAAPHCVHSWGHSTM